MLKPAINDLIKITENRYSLIIASSKRARQIIAGEEPMIESEIKKPVSIATREIFEGKIECIAPVEIEE